MKQSSRDLRARLLTAWRAAAGLCLCLLLAPATGEGAGAERRQPARRPTAPQASPSPTPTPVAPSVEFQASPRLDAVERGQSVTLDLSVSNKSSVTLSKFKVSVSGGAFEMVRGPSFPDALPPSAGAISASAEFKPRDDADFVQHKFPLTLEYAWESGGREFVTRQQTTVTLQVKPPLEKLTRLIPGLTPEQAYFLLPMIPAILMFYFFESWRRAEGFKFPAVADFILPLVLIAIVVGAVSSLLFNRRAGDFDYSDPRVLAAVLLVSAELGSVIPVGRMAYARLRRRQGFGGGETAADYLRKALPSAGEPAEFRWVRGKADGEQWEGILLRQPDGALVLGAQLQVSYPRQVSNEEWERFLREVIQQDGTVLDRERLVEMVRAEELSWDFMRRIQRGGQGLDSLVVIGEVKNLERAGSEASPLVIPIR